MEISLGSALTETKIRPPAAKRGPDKDGYVTRKERLEWDLKETYDDIKASLKEKGFNHKKFVFYPLHIYLHAILPSQLSTQLIILSNCIT